MLEHEVLAEGVEIYRGDCLEVLPTLAAGSVNLVVADPPYGIDYQSARRIDKSTWKPKLQGDDAPFLDWIPDSVRLLSNAGSCLCFCRWDVEQIFRDAIEAEGLSVKSQVIWDRMNHGMGDLTGSFSPQHDCIVFATKEGFMFPGARPNSIIRVPRIMPEALVHPTEKPVSLLVYLVSHLIRSEQLVIDPTMGSGTTGAACIQTKRRFIGIEIDKNYYEIAKQRLLKTLMQPHVEKRGDGAYTKTMF